MRPGDTRHVIVQVSSIAGAGVTGLAIGDFTVTSKYYPSGGSAWAAWSASEALTEIGSGLYEFEFTFPSVACEWDIRLDSDDGYAVSNGHWEGELETYDYDYLYGRIIRPVATITDDFALGATQPMSLIAYRYQTKQITIVDDDGNAVTLDTTYEDFVLCIRTTDGASKWEYRQNGANFEENIDGGGWSTLANGSLTVNDSGVFTIIFPDDADFYDQVTAAERPKDTGLYYDIRADLKAASGETCAIIRSSQLSLYLSEGGNS